MNFAAGDEKKHFSFLKNTERFYLVKHERRRDGGTDDLLYLLPHAHQPM